MAEFKAITKYVRISPRKARLAAALIRGLQVIDARLQLGACNLKGGRLLIKTLNSAVANAEMQSDSSAERLTVQEVRVDGGAMNSKFWAQILADATSKKILIPEVKDGAALGAAILVFNGSKKYESIDKAIANMVRITEVKEPIEENVKVYEKLGKSFVQALIDINMNERVTGEL